MEHGGRCAMTEQTALRDLEAEDMEDLTAGTVVVARSHASNTTRGGHADLLPIAEGLVPYLREALATSSLELLFPAEDGSQRAPDSALHKVLRRALGRAGLLPVCCWSPGAQKVKALEPTDKSAKLQGLRWSGRQDLNLRPLAPQGSPGAVQRLPALHNPS